jgi:ABC-type molybdate transport system substrate-binding protein
MTLSDARRLLNAVGIGYAYAYAVVCHPKEQNALQQVTSWAADCGVTYVELALKIPAAFSSA